MRNPPLPPLPTPQPGEPSRPNTTRRIWPEPTQPLVGASKLGLPDDDSPTRVLPARQLRWDTDPDAPTIGAPIPGALVSAPYAVAPGSRGGVNSGRGVSRNEWTLLVAAVGIVLLLVGTVAVLGLVRLPAPTSSGAPGNAHAPLVAATTVPTATATLAPTATATLPPAIQASFVTQDTATQGNWPGQYGAQGHLVIGDVQQLPDAIQVTPANQQQFEWADSTSDPRALQKASNPADRIAACWYAAGTFTIDVNITDGQTYQMAVYMLDWDQQNRGEIVNILDPATDAVLDTRSVTSFSGGAWLVWDVRGHIAIQITNAPGSLNAVVSGLFFGPAAQPGATPAISPSATTTPEDGAPPATPASAGDATPADTLWP